MYHFHFRKLRFLLDKESSWSSRGG